MSIAARTLIVAGISLLAFWAAVRVDSVVASQEGVDAFMFDRAAGGTVVNTALWSPERVTEFRKSIGLVARPPIALLQVPRIGVEVPVFGGTDDLTLNRGAGWIAGTANPGAPGNSGIAAHRDGFFRPLKDIVIGDVIELRTREGTQTYTVRTLSIVAPSRTDVLAPTQETTLTLVTCYPFYFVGSAPQRFIVHAARTDQEHAK